LARRCGRRAITVEFPPRQRPRTAPTEDDDDIDKGELDVTACKDRIRHRPPLLRRAMLRDMPPMLMDIMMFEECLGRWVSRFRWVAGRARWPRGLRRRTSPCTCSRRLPVSEDAIRDSRVLNHLAPTPRGVACEDCTGQTTGLRQSIGRNVIASEVTKALRKYTSTYTDSLHRRTLSDLSLVAHDTRHTRRTGRPPPAAQPRRAPSSLG
jgi:hypothetical protein